MEEREWKGERERGKNEGWELREHVMRTSVDICSTLKNKFLCFFLFQFYFLFFIFISPCLFNKFAILFPVSYFSTHVIIL